MIRSQLNDRENWLFEIWNSKPASSCSPNSKHTRRIARISIHRISCGSPLPVPEINELSWGDQNPVVFAVWVNNPAQIVCAIALENRVRRLWFIMQNKRRETKVLQFFFMAILSRFRHFSSDIHWQKCDTHFTSF